MVVSWLWDRTAGPWALRYGEALLRRGRPGHIGLLRVDGGTVDAAFHNPSALARWLVIEADHEQIADVSVRILGPGHGGYGRPLTSHEKGSLAELVMNAATELRMPAPDVTKLADQLDPYELPPNNPAALVYERVAGPWAPTVGAFLRRLNRSGHIRIFARESDTDPKIGDLLGAFYRPRDLALWMLANPPGKNEGHITIRVMGPIYDRQIGRSLLPAEERELVELIERLAAL